MKMENGLMESTSTPPWTNSERNAQKVIRNGKFYPDLHPLALSS